MRALALQTPPEQHQMIGGGIARRHEEQRGVASDDDGGVKARCASSFQFATSARRRTNSPVA